MITQEFAQLLTPLALFDVAERGGAVEGVLEGAPGEPGKPAEDSFELPPDPLNR